jgi:hypothetical protein
MNMENLFDQVSCQTHKRDYINIGSSFQIQCSKCVSEGLTGNEKLLFNKVELNKKNCHKHPQEEAMFYCDDCFEFICKNCFLLVHRGHNSSSPELIVNPIQESIAKTSNELKSLKKNIDDNIQNMQGINTFFVTEKTNYKNNLATINEQILKELKSKSSEFSEEIENIFQGVDLEVESSTTRLENTKKKANKVITELEALLKELESIKSDKKLCLFKKNKDGLIKEYTKYLSDLEIFIAENLEKTKVKSESEIENFNRNCAKFQKNAEIYESSVINTIISGIPNICMRIRRFKRYFYQNPKFFKTSNLCMLTSDTINLVGFSLCGLFSSSSIQTLKLEVKIYELESAQNFDPKMQTLITNEISLPVIHNITDPVFQFYLKNSVTIHKEKIYYIFINNTSSNYYVDCWNGEVSKDKDDMTENQNSIICNNTNIKFNFLGINGVESDFNEFTGGLISDIIYSYID